MSCLICFEKPIQSVKCPQCLKAFCKACLKASLERSLECPHCRTELLEVPDTWSRLNRLDQLEEEAKNLKIEKENELRLKFTKMKTFLESELSLFNLKVQQQRIKLLSIVNSNGETEDTLDELKLPSINFDAYF